jgi:hypothetical protein
VRPIQTASLTGGLDFQSSVAGGAYVDLMTLLGGASGGSLGIGTNAPTATRLHIVDNVITTGNGILATTNSMTTGNFVYLTSNSSAAGSNTQTVLNVATTGTNATTTQTTYGLQVANTHAGTLSTNIAGLFKATTGTAANIGLSVAAMTDGAANTGVNITSFTGTAVAVNTGVAIGPFSGSTGASTNTGVSIGAIGGVSANAYGINIGTLTGGTTGNYQINTGIITSVASASNYGINLGGTTGSAALSNNYGIKIGTMSSTGAANYGLNILSPSGATHNSALVIGAVPTATGTWAVYSADVNKSYFAGSIGIGTTTPVGQFQVAATAAPTADMMTISNAGYGVITAGTSALQVNYIGGAAAIESSSIRSDITAGGATGGTWNALRLVGSTAASGVIENGIKIDNLTAGTGSERALFVGTGWDFGIYSTTTGVSSFAGNIGIGTTAPALALDVVGNARFSAIGSGAYTGAVNRMADGTLTTATSDIRFKKDIITIESPLEKVLALRGVTYNWKDPNSPKRMMGMIAQEVKDIVPELVFQNSDGYYGINYGETVGLLIEAIKVQEIKIDDIRQIVDQNTTDIENLQILVNEKLDAASDILARNIDTTNEANSSLIITDTLIAKNIKAENIEGLRIIQAEVASAQNDVSSNSVEVESFGQQIANLQIAVADLTKSADIVKSLNVDGGLIVNGSAEFQGPTIFRVLADFVDKVIFRNNVEFAGQVQFNQDSAGYAIINKGEKKVEVIFEKEYADVPIINANLSVQNIKDEELRSATEDLILASDVKYLITNVSTKGFEIKISSLNDWEIPFAWQAISVKDAKTTQAKVDNERVIEVKTEASSELVTPKAETEETPLLIETVSVQQTIVPSENEASSNLEVPVVSTEAKNDAEIVSAND